MNWREKIEGNIKVTRRRFVFRMGQTVLVLPFLGGGCNIRASEGMGEETKKEKNTMIQGISAEHRSIPAIDASAPSRYERATFALG